MNIIELTIDQLADILLLRSQSMNKAETEWMPNSRRIWNTVTNTLPILLHYNGDKTYAAHREMVKRILA